MLLIKDKLFHGEKNMIVKKLKYEMQAPERISEDYGIPSWPCSLTLRPRSQLGIMHTCRKLNSKTKYKCQS